MEKKKPLAQQIVEAACDSDNCLTDVYIDDYNSINKKNFEKEIAKAIVEGYKTFSSDFYVDIRFKSERILADVVKRLIFFTRRSCPTPAYDQTVYRIHRKSGDVRLLWTIPRREVCSELLFTKDLNPVTAKIVEFIRDFYSEKLLNIALKLNNENNETKDY